ncbi:MAG TPA: hypothetical protein VH680_19520 [Gemmatimonadales bacterium]
MNFAFPALLVFLLVLPGIILRYSYARGPWGWASPTSMRRVSEELAYGVAFALVLHAVWLALVRWLGFQPDVAAMVLMLLGNFGAESQYLGQVLDSVAGYYPGIAGYLVSLYSAAAVAGNLGHRAVRRLRLDHLTKTFRFDNYWYYMLTGEVLDFRENAEDGREVDGVYCSAVVDHASGSYLYRGIVSDFTFDRDGALDTIVLMDAHRRRLTDDRAEDEPRPPVGPAAPDERYYEIRGDFLVLRASEFRTLNLDYFAVTLEEPGSGTPGEGGASP